MRTQFVHALDDPNPIVTQSSICLVAGSASDPVASIGKLGNPLAQSVEQIHILDRSKVVRVLLADQDSDLAHRLDTCEIGRTVDTHEVVTMPGHKVVPKRHVSQRFSVYVPPTVSHATSSPSIRGCRASSRFESR